MESRAWWEALEVEDVAEEDEEEEEAGGGVKAPGKQTGT